MAEPAVGAGPPERAAPAPAPAAGRLVPDSGAVDEESEDRKNVQSATVPVGEPAHRNPGTEDSSAASSPLARLTALNPFGRELKPAERAGDPGAGAAASSVLPGPWLTVRCHPLTPMLLSACLSMATVSHQAHDGLSVWRLAGENDVPDHQERQRWPAGSLQPASLELKPALLCCAPPAGDSPLSSH